MDVITNPASNFTFFDQVPAALKPTSDGTDDGIKVQGASGGTLEIDAPDSDSLIQVTQSAASSATVTVTNNSGTPDDFDDDFVAQTRFGSGVTHLTFRTDNHASDYYPNGGTEIEVATNVNGLPGLNPSTHLTVDTGSGTYDTILLGGNGVGESVTDAKVITGGGHDRLIVFSDDDDATTVSADFGAGTGTGDGLGLGNTLEVHQALCNVTLAQLAGTSHTVVVDDVTVDGGAALLVGSPSTIGDLEVNGTSGFGPSTAVVQSGADGTTINTFGVDSSATASIEGQSAIGTFTVEGIAEFTAASSPTTVDNFDTSTGSVTVDGGANVTDQHTSLISTLEIDDGGVLTVQAHSGTSAEVLTVKTLTINLGTGSSAGKLDLTDNVMIIDYDSGSPISTVQSLIGKAFDNGPWDGDGITSSSAAAQAGASHKTALGYAEASDLGVSSYAGQSVDGTALIIRYTWFGDCNIDGTVDLTDFTFMSANFNAQNQHWLQGDVNYDGNVDLTDFTLLASNFNQTGFPS